MKKKKAYLILENGDVYEGEPFGYVSDSVGEIVFNTSHTGYQEILTDPSYYNQIITFTYPLIGNYGVYSEVMQSKKIQARGLVVREYCKNFSSIYKEAESLDSFLKKYKVIGIEGVDTRDITLKIRKKGAMKSGIFVSEEYQDSFLQEVRSSPDMENSDLVQAVTTQKVYSWNQNGKYKIAVYDFGVKKKILELLAENHFSVQVYPAFYEIERIQDADAFFFSNGPGDPKVLDYAIENIKKILTLKKPIFGICLGFQLISLAFGFKTQKMKFGHRGSNQPVKDFINGQTKMTSQNHGFEVLMDETKKRDLLEVIGLDFSNLNDRTVEGMRGKNYPLLAVQYHPESCPGPNESRSLFQDFFHITDTFYQN